MDEGTGREHYAPADIRIKTVLCSLLLLRSYVFYHAERILSAIAKFLLYFFREEEGELKWQRGEVGEESGEERKRGGKLECTKNSPKRNRFGIWGRCFIVIHIWKALFRDNISVVDSIPLEPFKSTSNRASKPT